MSLLFSIIFTYFFNQHFFSNKNMSFNANIQRYQSTLEENIVTSVLEKENFEISNESNVSNNENRNIIKNEWQIKIPKINLKADIAEGTETEILNEFVGHFVETPKDVGNIVLAAHNRGYNVNYFENLKELEIGDEIYYTYNNLTRTYQISLITIIKDTDWNNLRNTNDNRITLITCVENEPEYRRCLQAIEVK